MSAAETASSGEHGDVVAVAVKLRPEDRSVMEFVQNNTTLRVVKTDLSSPRVFTVRQQWKQENPGQKLRIEEVDFIVAPQAGRGGAGRKPAPGRVETEAALWLRRVLDDAALTEASDIQMRVQYQKGIGEVDLRVRGKMTGVVHKIPAAICDRMLNIVFADADAGPQTLQIGVNQSGALLAEEKLPLGVGGIRFQTVWPGNGWHLNMRLRYAQSTLGISTVDDLGLPDTVIRDLQYISTASRGVVLVSGPTESGKSTLLATLTKQIWDLHDERLTIVSVEDPVEEWYDHLLQIDVNTDERGDDAWVEAQKIFTRVAPDVGQIGEIRTGEAAERAYSFADTGKLTFATIHVSSALDVPTRLMRGMAVSESRVLDPAQNPAWTSQRLIPTLCEHCRVPERDADRSTTKGRFRAATVDAFASAGLDVSSACGRGPGCDHCAPRARDGRSMGGTPGLVGRRLVLEAVLPTVEICDALGRDTPRSVRDIWLQAGGLPLSTQVWDMVVRGEADILDYRHHIGGPEELCADIRAIERGKRQRSGRQASTASAPPPGREASPRVNGGSGAHRHEGVAGAAPDPVAGEVPVNLRPSRPAPAPRLFVPHIDDPVDAPGEDWS